MVTNEGLRARKLRETRDAIHRAAVALALELGPDAATVAEISARANISQRTFFNYYPTKEDAIVGLHEGLPSDAELDEFRAGGPDGLIHDIIELLQGVRSSDEVLMQQTRALIAEYPQLIQRQWARFLGVEQRTAAAAAERMRACGKFDHLDIDVAARALVVTCSNVLRLSVRTAIDEGAFPGDLDDRITHTMTTLREVLRTLK